MATVTLTNDNHDQTVKDGIVFIDFWAAWCGPCLMFAPIFERAAEKHPDITFAKVDTDDQVELAGRYGVQSIPTLVIYRDGIPLFAQPGALPEPVLEDLIAQTRDLDMDDVRAKYAEQLAAAEKS
jgi:thioredoxin 1